MKRILAIVGPTASGKTSFALNIALQVLASKNQDNDALYAGVDLISVDSRQVYSDLQVLSGSDVPEDFLPSSEFETDRLFEYPYFKHNSMPVTLHGVSILDLSAEWSVAHFKEFATKIILECFNQNRLPILVGGTGMYHEHLFSTDDNLFVPPNKELRLTAKSMNVQQLQTWLQEVNSEKLAQMNNSDINNPRRLVRAIEIALGIPKLPSMLHLPTNIQVTTLGLQLTLEKLETKIRTRVIERFASGAIQEVTKVLELCEHQDMPICTTLGVTDIAQFLSKEISQDECIDLWALHEYQYAKRQLTWFTKQPEIIWLDDFQKKQYTFK